MHFKKMTLHINGADRMFICDPHKDSLADVLRRLGLTGTKVGCGKGVCGACYTSQKPQRIRDVLEFPGHIACDSASRSELCVPILMNGRCIAEIDLDAPVPDRFTEEMEKEMLQAAEDIASAFLQHHWSV